MKPIIMTAESVRSILAGKKTQTRRIIKPQPRECDHSAWETHENDPSEFVCCEDGQGWHCAVCGNGVYYDNKFEGIKCPFGIVGDRLWVKEAFAYADDGFITYKADSNEEPTLGICASRMTRKLSRLTLEIVNIRVERVREITNEDAVSEGVISDKEYFDRAGLADVFPCPACGGYQVVGPDGSDCVTCDTEIKRFKILWNKINGKRASWESNPFVWVIDFKRIGGEQ